MKDAVTFLVVANTFQRQCTDIAATVEQKRL